MQLDAVSVTIQNEIERLRGINHQDDLEAEEATRVIAALKAILEVTNRMENHIPLDREATEDDADAAISLIETYRREFASWARSNVSEIVDSTCRLSLVDLSTGIMTACGAPVAVSAGIAALAYGGSKLKQLGSAFKGSLKD